jgi:tryptophan synthase alpha chain
VAPNTGAQRLEAAIRASTGFLYVIPLFGVTGARSGLAPGAAQLVARIRGVAAGRAPVACGFGVSRAEHVRELAAVADGIIVGSALVAALGDASPTGGPQRVASLVSALSQATGAPAPLRGSHQIL